MTLEEAKDIRKATTWRTEVVALAFPSGGISNELQRKLNALEVEGRTIFQIINIPNSLQVMVVSFR